MKSRASVLLSPKYYDSASEGSLRRTFFDERPTRAETSAKPPSLPLPMRYVPYIILPSVALGLAWAWLYASRPYQPLQPVPFSHATHTAADKAAMPCQACHAAAEKGRRAGMPAASGCLDCHRHILAADAHMLPLHAAANPDSPVYTGEPVRWIRKAALPAYAYFNHAPHLAKGYGCERCHPDPDAAEPFSMASCLECHRTEKMPTDCTQCHH